MAVEKVVAMVVVGDGRSREDSSTAPAGIKRLDRGVQGSRDGCDKGKTGGEDTGRSGACGMEELSLEQVEGSSSAWQSRRQSVPRGRDTVDSGCQGGSGRVRLCCVYGLGVNWSLTCRVCDKTGAVKSTADAGATGRLSLSGALLVVLALLALRELLELWEESRGIVGVLMEARNAWGEALGDSVN